MADNEKMNFEAGDLGMLDSADNLLVGSEDDQLIQNFFADFKEDIPDNGFSDRVMRRIPDTYHQRLARWWQVACVVVGIVFLCSDSVRGSLQDLLFASKIDMMLQLSRGVCRLGETLGQSNSWLMTLAGMFTLVCVWGYNEWQDARLG